MASRPPPPPPPPSPSPPQPAGELVLPPPLADKLVPVALLATGAFGRLLHVLHRDLGRPAALKLLKPEVADEEARGRLRREALLTSRLRHPNLVEVYDAGTAETGEPWILFEYVEGTDLDARAHRGPVPLDRIFDWGIEIADALHALHGAGIVHRDVKPRNVMVRPDDRSVLCDLGLARGSGDLTRLTRDGTLMGTMHYLAPEIVLGAPATALSDQFAWGASLWWLWFRAHAHPAKTITDLLEMKARRTPVEIPVEAAADSPELAAILVRSLAPDPGKRFQSLELMARALEEVRDSRRRTSGVAVPTHPPSRGLSASSMRIEPIVDPPSRPVAARSWVARTLPGSLLLAGVLAVMAWRSPPPSADPGSPSPVPTVAHDPSPTSDPETTGEPGDPDPDEELARAAGSLGLPEAPPGHPARGRAFFDPNNQVEAILDPRFELRWSRFLQALLTRLQSPSTALRSGPDQALARHGLEPALSILRLVRDIENRFAANLGFGSVQQLAAQIDRTERWTSVEPVIREDSAQAVLDLEEVEHQGPLVLALRVGMGSLLENPKARTLVPAVEAALAAGPDDLVYDWLLVARELALWERIAGPRPEECGPRLRGTLLALSGLDSRPDLRDRDQALAHRARMLLGLVDDATVCSPVWPPDALKRILDLHREVARSRPGRESSVASGLPRVPLYRTGISAGEPPGELAPVLEDLVAWSRASAR